MMGPDFRAFDQMGDIPNSLSCACLKNTNLPRIALDSGALHWVPASLCSCQVRSILSVQSSSYFTLSTRMWKYKVSGLMFEAPMKPCWNSWDADSRQKLRTVFSEPVLSGSIPLGRFPSCIMISLICSTSVQISHDVTCMLHCLVLSKHATEAEVL